MGDPEVKAERPREDAELGRPDWAGWPRRPSFTNPLGLPAPLTGKQLFYLLGPQMLGAAIIDGAANLGIACAMYRTANKPIRIWPLDDNSDVRCNSGGSRVEPVDQSRRIAGDLGVTVFIQGIASFVIASGLVHVDLRLRRVDPFPHPWPDTSFGVVRINGPEHATTRHGRVWRTFHQEHGLGRGLHFFSGSDVQDVFDFRVGWSTLWRRWFWSLWKGSVLSALYWFIFWPIAIAIVAPIWDGDDLKGSWAPELIKLIYGFLLGLLMNPVIACIALGSEDAVRLHLRDEQREAISNHRIDDDDDDTRLATSDGEKEIAPPGSPAMGEKPASVPVQTTTSGPADSRGPPMPPPDSFAAETDGHAPADPMPDSSTADSGPHES